MKKILDLYMFVALAIICYYIYEVMFSKPSLVLVLIMISFGIINACMIIVLIIEDALKKRHAKTKSNNFIK